jgi:hypothetical protein
MASLVGKTHSPKAIDIRPPPFVVDTKPAESRGITGQQTEYTINFAFGYNI